MAKDLAIVLSNGSLNSVVAAALAAQRYRLILIHGQVGTNPSSCARTAYDQQVGYYKPYREHTVPMPQLSVLQAATDPVAQVDPRQGGLLAPQLVSLLPLVSSAVPFAVQHQASAIYLGLRIGGNPDDLAQAMEYVQIFNELLQVPCNQKELELVTPLLELEPWQVVDVGVQVGAPLERSWSCMEDGAEPCGACRGCRARDGAFQQAAKMDPLRVKAAK